MSQNTIANYTFDVEKLVQFLVQKEIVCSPLQISEAVIQQFIYEMATQVNPRSQSRLISGLKSFFNYLIFEDPRIKNTLARAIIEQSKIKDFLNDLNIDLSNEKYLLEKKLFNIGIPSKDIQKLQNQLFSLEANFLELNGIDQKKGCYIGQENTARMHLKNKVNKRLFALQITNGKVQDGQKINFDNEEIGKVLIDDLFPFGLIKINKENKNLITNKELKTETATIKINIPNWMVI